MDRQEELRINRYQDAWSKLYLHLARTVTETFGIEGEQLLRQGIRHFGVDRGRAQRENHMRAGLKPNLLNLFSKGDLPGDPRFRRNKIKLTEQERLSETLVCPIAAMWRSMDGLALGRIYCEEFHHAKFGAYAPKAQINLSQTLTQEGDIFCRFSVYLRPGNMDAAERKEVFTAYDSAYQPERAAELDPVPFKEGFATLCIKLYQHIAAVVLGAKGKEGEAALCAAGLAFVEDLRAQLKDFACQLNRPLDNAFLEEHIPFSEPSASHDASVWALYTDARPQTLFAQMTSELFRPV